MKTTYIYVYISLNSSKDETFFDKSCRENQNTHFTFKTFFPENRTIYQITWKIR